MNKLAFLEGYLMEKEAGFLTNRFGHAVADATGASIRGVEKALTPIASGIKNGAASFGNTKVGGGLKRLASKTIEPVVTATSGGGMGVGSRVKHTPFMFDIDPTGPGLGLAIKNDFIGRALKKIPMKSVRKAGEKIEKIPGMQYHGVEFAGITPTPFAGLAVNPAEKDALVKALKELAAEFGDTKAGNRVRNTPLYKELAKFHKQRTRLAGIRAARAGANNIPTA